MPQRRQRAMPHRSKPPAARRPADPLPEQSAQPGRSAPEPTRPAPQQPRPAAEQDKSDAAPAGEAEPDPVDPEPVAGTARRWRRALLIIGLALLLLAAGGALYGRSVVQRVDRVDAFGALPEAHRPSRGAPQALNLLILGSDARNPDSPDARADTIMLLHLPARRDQAQLISIPRDTWVTVPRTPDGQRGGRKAKINAAYEWGGAPLMVRTVEEFTGVRIDHVVILEFAGFERIVDAIGGIEIDIETTFTSIHPPHRVFHQGRQRLDGAAALDYARQRKQFPDGDFARIRHQQQLLVAILDQAARGGLLTNPVRLNNLLRATADAVTTDHTLPIIDLAWQLRGLRGSQITRLTSPSARIGQEGKQSVVYPDTAKARGLYQAVRDDDVPRWLAENPPR